MARRRVLYGLILVAVLLFQITNNNYLAHLLLALTVALPVLSLLLSLPAMVTCRLKLSARPADLLRGESAQWHITPELRTGLPLSRLTLRLEEENLLTGEKAAKRLTLNGVTRRIPICRPGDTSHCGLLELRIRKLKVCDFLGLFSIPLPRPEPARLTVRPVPVDPGPLNIPDGSGSRPSTGTPQKKGLGEDYDLREYRPGDPLRTVHWKLSSKWDDLIVREPAETFVSLPLLTFDRWGTPERLDAVLDRLTGYCGAFLAVQRPHAVQWLDEKGKAVLHNISDEKDLRACLQAILSAPAPVQPPSAPDWDDTVDHAVFRIHVSMGEEAEHD